MTDWTEAWKILTEPIKDDPKPNILTSEQEGILKRQFDEIYELYGTRPREHRKNFLPQYDRIVKGVSGSH